MIRKGSVLMSAILCCGILLSAAALLAASAITTSQVFKQRLKASKVFYLADAGIEFGKARLSTDSLWHTESLHAADDKYWLVFFASGESFSFGEGGFKIVREDGIDRLYSIGYLGPDISKSSSYCFQKITFDVPFKIKGWEVF